jgi:hypothetical protein
MRYVEWDEQYLAISSTEWLRRCGKYELPRRSMVMGLLVAADGVWAKYKFSFLSHTLWENGCLCYLIS